MSKYVHTETKQHTMKLVQMGAKVEVISSQMVYVSFDITEDFTVSYVYNINRHNKYFLERIEPYPIDLEEFDSTDDIVNIIKIDVEQFKTAVKSHNIKDFVKINQDFHNTILAFEDLFLYYNLPTKYVSKIKGNIEAINDIIKKASHESKRVYFGKEPGHLEE